MGEGRPRHTVRAFPWGDASPTCALANHWYYNGSSYSYCVGDTSQVGSYPTGASQYGALDMAGNVWEWVNDWYGDTYYSTSPYANPPGPVTGTYKVLRGGSWDNYDYYLRVAYRYVRRIRRIHDYRVSLCGVPTLTGTHRKLSFWRCRGLAPP